MSKPAYLAAGIGVFIYMGSAEHTLDEQMGLVLRTIADIEDAAAR